MELDELVANVSGETNINVLVSDTDREALSNEPCVDTSDRNWRRNIRAEIIESHKSIETKESDEDGDMDQPLKVPEVSSVKGALIEFTKQLAEFADWRGEEQLSLAVGYVYVLLGDFQLKSLKQSTLDSLFLFTKIRGTFVSSSYQTWTLRSMGLHLPLRIGVFLHVIVAFVTVFSFVDVA